jgi:Flp pilus assembly protein TadD
MNFIKPILAMLLLLMSITGWSQQGSAKEDPIQMLSKGYQLLQSGKPEEAITQCFDKVLTEYQKKYGNSKGQIYCARNSTESLFYLLKAANEDRSAEVLTETTWADAFFMKGYALAELGRLSEAKESIEKAIALTPMNAQYLSELGYIYEVEKNWSKALELYQSAEDAATEFSEPAAKSQEISRARRGLGYVYVELGQLDKAEKVYRQCLEINPNDERAKNELEFVLEQQKSKEPN